MVVCFDETQSPALSRVLSDTVSRTPALSRVLPDSLPLTWVATGALDYDVSEWWLVPPTEISIFINDSGISELQSSISIRRLNKKQSQFRSGNFSDCPQQSGIFFQKLFIFIFHYL